VDDREDRQNFVSRMGQFASDSDTPITGTVIPYHQNVFQAIMARIGFSSRKLMCMVTSRFLEISQTFNDLT